MNTEKPTNIVIKEMEKERDVYLKNSTPWRRVNRAIKKLQKLDKIEQIVKEWENSKIVINCYECAEQIKEVLNKE